MRVVTDIEERPGFAGALLDIGDDPHQASLG